MDKLKNNELLQSLMNGGPDIVRKLMPMATKDMIEPMLEKTDLLKFGGDLLASACQHGKADILELLIQRGADVMNPPELVQGDETYRKSPFSIQAVCGGDIDTFKAVLRCGGSMSDVGFICLSKKKRNLVISNAIGAAAFHGRTKMLELIAKKLPVDAIELQAMEEPDKHSKSTSYQREFLKYTPLMLTIAGGDQNLDCMRLLLQQGANFQCKDLTGNSILHIAAMNSCNKMLDYIAKNLN